jgi:hypothetical protein
VPAGKFTGRTEALMAARAKSPEDAKKNGKKNRAA